MLSEEKPTKPMRLSKFLAFCGVASRRKTKKLILEGKVEINGKTVTDLSYRVDPQKDVVKVEGKLIKVPPKVYYMFYKPPGVLTTLYDPHAQNEKETIKPFLEKLPYKVFPVGRLDKESEGLLLLTNDGDLAYKLLHPKFGIKRTYLVWVKPFISQRKINKVLKEGVKLKERLVKPVEFKFIRMEEDYNVYKVIVKEGIKREVRKIVGYLGARVYRLLRISFGPLKLVGLKPGEIRELTEEEKKKLFDFLKNL